MKKLLFIVCLILTVMLISCDSHDQDTIESIQSETSLISEELTPQTETEAYDPADEEQNPEPIYVSPYDGVAVEPFTVDGVVWLNRPDWKKRTAVDDPVYGTLHLFQNLQDQFKEYEDHPEQKYAVTVRYFLPYSSTKGLRQSPEHLYAIEKGMTWNGLDADTALDLYDQHRCLLHRQEDHFSYIDDELINQYINVIMQDQYAEYRRNGMQVIELYWTEDMLYIPPPVLIIGTKEQILSIQNKDRFIWHVGLSVYHPEILEASYADQVPVMNEDYCCYDPEIEARVEHMKWYYDTKIAPMGNSKAWFIEQIVDDWEYEHYNTYSESFRTWCCEE